LKQKIDKVDKMIKEIEECKNCKELSTYGDLSLYIEENGECLKDEERSGHHGDRYFTEGEKEFSLRCEECKAQWVWSKSWITDNGGEGVTRNGIDYDY
jgi:hypothetical protein